MIKTINTKYITDIMLEAQNVIDGTTTYSDPLSFKDAADIFIAMAEAAPAVKPAQAAIKCKDCLDTGEQLGVYGRIKCSCKEPAQAVPVGRVLRWKGAPGLAPKTCIRGFDEYSKGYAQLGPWEEGENVYTAPPAVDDDTKKMVLELCDAVQEHVLVWTYPCGKQTLELAKQIREKLEVGK